MSPMSLLLRPHLPPSRPNSQQLRMARSQLEGINNIEGISCIRGIEDMAIRGSMSMSMSRPTASAITPLKGQANDLRLGLAVAGLAARRSMSRQGREDMALGIGLVWFGFDCDSG